MKNLLIIPALLLLISVNALAGSEYDKCLKEEKSLKVQEAGDCSGLKYLLNPSACYATQKTLKEYKGGKCRQIGITENVDFSVPKAIPEKINPAVATTASTVTGNNTASVPAKKDVREIQQQKYSIDQLKEENERLKAEISRLKTENEQLRKAVR